eukprot:TRINITY_DN6525_c0_g1_i1.p1 TRINITY_DN6525_c0_g1~~TRINITY_DN6525_c0_g1_i1.p1  ORF type:complete len:108 (+),score=5.92 TRINITY_DN6525_c0_g1_i1:366-689(+)
MREVGTLRDVFKQKKTKAKKKGYVYIGITIGICFFPFFAGFCMLPGGLLSLRSRVQLVGGKGMSQSTQRIRPICRRSQLRPGFFFSRFFSDNFSRIEIVRHVSPMAL